MSGPDQMQVRVRKASEEDYREWQRTARDGEYLATHYEELLAQYPDSWIAILNEHVVGVAPQLEQLLADLRSRGVPVGPALIRHLTASDDILILHNS